MGLLQRIKLNVDDARTFGPGILMRHVARVTGAKTTQVNMPSVGPVHVRVGESDVAALRQVFGEGDYDLGSTSPVTERIRARAAAIKREGGIPVIVDAGANIGAASLWLRATYPDAALVAIEPEPANAAVLHRNLDGLPNVTVLDAAVGAEPGFVSIANDVSGWGARTLPAEHGIPVVTIPDAVAKVPGGVPLIVKIDIEGFERELFARNLDWIADAYAVIIEPHDWMLPGQQSSRNFQRAMAAHEFELFLSGENLIYVRV